MPQTALTLADLRCPACGGPLGGFPPESLCAGIRCLSCNWAQVTTNPNPRLASHDRTAYDVWIEFAPHERVKAIAAAANATYVGVAAAREVVDAAAPVARGLQALEVRRLVGELRRSGFGVRIRPEFPWPLG
jgi:hypothetical protein